MTRASLRLVACVTAVAVLLTNTPGLLAAMRFQGGPARVCHQCCHDSHCDCHEESPGRSDEDRGQCLANEGGPFKNNGPSCPFCPSCPGGPAPCHWCSVSHVIGTLPAPSLHLADDAPPQRLPESALVLPAAHGGELIRPPRS